MKKSEFNELLKTELFVSCNPLLLSSILDNSPIEVKEFLENDVINSPENKEKTIGVILSGKASVWTASEPVTLLRFLEKGSIFGVANLFTKENYVSLILAEKKTKVLFLEKITIENIMANDKNFLNSLLTFYSERISFLNKKINYLTAGSAEHKLALVLLNSKEDEILLQNSIGSFSELLNLGRASLYRAFDKLVALNLIEKDGRKIVISNRQKLAEYCQNTK